MDRVLRTGVSVAALCLLALCSGSWAQGAGVAGVNGTLSSVGTGEDAISVLTLWGTPYEMGYAHGKLAAGAVKGFYTGIITAMVLGMGVRVEVLDDAWRQMEPFVAERYKEEMRGLAEGSGVPLAMVQRAHAIPDLSEFHCTFFSAWGSATRDGHLHQIRALDYATEAGIQDHPALIVYKPTGRSAFVEVGWLGFIGCVSGMSARHIAVSEIGDDFDKADETLAGEPMPFVLRRVLEDAEDLDSAVAIIQGAHRTSSYLYCVGDGQLPGAVKLRTSPVRCEVFGPQDQGDTSLENVVYWSMGCDSQWNRKVHDVLAGKLGQIDPTVGMNDVMQGLRTGDLHAIHYDATALQMWVANATPGPANAPAYDQGFVHFDAAAALK